MKNNTIKEIATELNKAEKIVIFPHILMDGDALGSSVARSASCLPEGVDFLNPSASDLISKNDHRADK